MLNRNSSTSGLICSELINGKQTLQDSLLTDVCPSLILRQIAILSVHLAPLNLGCDCFRGYRAIAEQSLSLLEPMIGQ